MRKVLSKLTLLAAGALTALILLEGVFRLLPVSMGLHRHRAIRALAPEAYQPGQPYTYSKSWQFLNVRHGVTNNYGHPARLRLSPAITPVVVIGDSFVESLMNSHARHSPRTLGARLGSASRLYGWLAGLSATAISLALKRIALRHEVVSAAVWPSSFRRIAINDDEDRCRRREFLLASRDRARKSLADNPAKPSPYTDSREPRRAQAVLGDVSFVRVHERLDKTSPITTTGCDPGDNRSFAGWPYCL